MIQVSTFLLNEKIIPTYDISNTAPRYNRAKIKILFIKIKKID